MSDAMIEMAPGSRDGDDRRWAWRQEWGDLTNGIDYETWLEGKLLAAEDERDEWHRRQRGDEEQLVRIANYFGKDARQAPDDDRTIAGMVIAEVEKLRAGSLADIPPTCHWRRCRDCGSVAMHADSIVPYVLCRKCGSQDTRRVNHPDRPHGVPQGGAGQPDGQAG